MKLNENPLFKLPKLMAGAFSGMDRLYLPYDSLILKQVTQRDDNGNIELGCKAKDGPEEKHGGVIFLTEDRRKKDQLYNWLLSTVGTDIETIFESEFNFSTNDICPKCSSEMFDGLEPKIANLASSNSKLPNQTKFSRCSNKVCNYREKA